LREDTIIGCCLLSILLTVALVVVRDVTSVDAVRDGNDGGRRAEFLVLDRATSPLLVDARPRQAQLRVERKTTLSTKQKRR